MVIRKTHNQNQKTLFLLNFGSWTYWRLKIFAMVGNYKCRLTYKICPKRTFQSIISLYTKRRKKNRKVVFNWNFEKNKFCGLCAIVISSNSWWNLVYQLYTNTVLRPYSQTILRTFSTFFCYFYALIFSFIMD